MCAGLAQLVPSLWIWGYAVQAVLLSAPPWLMALWPLWSLVVAWRTGHRLVPALLGGVGLLLMGRPERAPAAPPAGWKVVAANVNAFTGNEALLESSLALLSADVLILIERRGADIAGMVRLADDFDADLPRPSHHTAVFCRSGLPCEATVTAQIGSPTMAMPFALVRLDERLCFVGIHAPPPIPFDPTGMAPYIDHLTSRLSGGRLTERWGPCEASDAVVVLGDLNAVPGSAPHRALLAAGLRDARAHTGVFGVTWPSGGDWPELPVFRLDQVLLGVGVTVSGLHAVAVPDSDHKATVGWYQRP